MAGDQEISAGVAILALLKAKPDEAEELDAFLRSARDSAVAEEGTVTWHAFRVDDTTFGVFDTFADEDGRQAHLNGEICERGRIKPGPSRRAGLQPGRRSQQGWRRSTTTSECAP